MPDRPRGDELVAAFERWAAGQRAGAAAASRARERSLREQAAAAATWSGVLVDLAEQAARVTALVAGQRRSGRIVGVGRDFFVFEPGHGHPALICMDAVSALWPDTDAAMTPGGSRSGAIDLSLMTALALLAEQRAPITIATTTGPDISGDLLAAGDDVLTVRTDPPGRRLTYVPMSSVARCDLR